MYKTPNKTTCINISELESFHYLYNEKTKRINKKQIVLHFKSSHGILLNCRTIKEAEKVFNDLYDLSNTE